MAIDEQNHYEVLGVPVDASAEVIRVAYREQAKASHPDTGGDASTFRRVREAFEVLSDPARRRAYDQRSGVRHVATGAAGWRAAGVEDEGWAGARGGFTGDVEFPDWLRDLTDEPWRRAEAPASADEPAATRPADVLWWWPDRATAPPTVAEQLVLVGTDDAVVAIDVLTGREAWRAETAARVEGRLVATPSLAVAWTSDGVLHGLDRGRGVTEWELPVGRPGPGGLCRPGDDDTTVVAATADDGGTLVAVDTGRPRVRWRARLGAETTAPLVATRGTVVAGTHRSVEAVEVRKGRHLWRAAATRPILLPPCPTVGGVWVAVGGGTMHLLDLTTGAARVSWDSRSTVAGMASAGASLYVTVAGPSQLVAVNQRGAVQWAVGTATTCPEPALLAGMAYLADPGGTLRAIDVVEGATAATHRLAFEPLGPPVGAIDRLVLGDRSGRLWAVALP